MEPTHRYEAIISAIDLDKIYYEVNKKSRLGAPVELNYAAMIITFFIRYVECIPTIKDLLKRLNDDFDFKLNCGFGRRTAVELVNGYLKEFFQLNNVRYLPSKCAKIHFDLITWFTMLQN